MGNQANETVFDAHVRRNNGTDNNRSISTQITFEVMELRISFAPIQRGQAFSVTATSALNAFFRDPGYVVFFRKLMEHCFD